MPRLPECDSCFFCAAHHAIVCAVHPAGPAGDSCPDFQPDPQLKGKRFVGYETPHAHWNCECGWVDDTI